MSKLSDFLVESVIGKPIVTFGGGFKPPTYGHLSVVKKAIEKYPTREKFIIFVGSGERDGITQEQSYKIWNIYKKYLPSDIEIIKCQSPIKSILDYSKENPSKNIIFIIGAREENKQDEKDFEGKIKSVVNYPNLTPVQIMTNGGVSGTLARQALKKGKEEFFKFLPKELSEEDKEEVYNIITSHEELNEGKQVGTLYHYTSYYKLEKIINTNTLLSYSIRNEVPNTKKEEWVYSISFTRDKNFHKRTRHVNGKDCRIIIDGDKLSQKYRITPVAEKGYERKKSISGKFPYSESEERIWSENKFQINNIKNYIIKVELITNPYYGGALEDAIETLKKNNVSYETLFSYYNVNEIKDKIPGGLSKGKSIKDLAKKHKTTEDAIQSQLKKGIKIEMEHTTDKNIAKEIAMDHVWEDAKYYDKLSTIEESESDIISMTNSIISYMEESWENYKHIIPAINNLEDKYDIPVQQTAAESVKIFANQIGAEAIEPLYRLTKQTGLIKENLISHATYEINKAGLLGEDSDYGGLIGKAVLELIEIFSKQGHSGFSTMWVNELFSKLSKYETLTELTSSEDEWTDVAEYDLEDEHQKLWQSKRNPACFSLDGGKTYYHIDDPKTIKETLKESLQKYNKGMKKSLITEVKNILKENIRNINYNSIINELNSYAQRKGWNVEPLPQLKLIENDDDNANDFFGKTAYYEPITKTIALYTKERHPKDIMRSYCHELRHHHQNLENKLQNINTENINEDDYLKEIEKDAYLEGNLLFREWENNKKSLNEGKQVGLLYHSTNPTNAIQILKYNRMKGNYHEGVQPEKNIKSVSTTRNKNFHYDNNKIQFVLDGDKISNKYKIIPFDYWGREYNIPDNPHIVDEDEEIIVVKNYLDNIKEYIINVNLSTKDEELISILDKLNIPYNIKSLNEYVNDSKQVLYCDLDGVLGDFDARFQYFAKMKPQDYEKKYGKEAFWDLIDNQVGEVFWTGIEWMPEGEKLWNYIKKYNPIILSAPSRNAVSRLGKKKWVEEYMPGTKLILADRSNKMEYSGKNKILIDDRADTISEWISQGGIGILFKSTEQTINDLEKLNLKTDIKENNKILITRRSKEEREKNHVIAIQKQIQDYIKNGSKGGLDLSGTPITSLPDNLIRVNGSLDLGKSKITSLPDNLTRVGGSLFLSNTPITSLPDNLTVGGNLTLIGCPITSLPDNLKFNGSLDLGKSKITSLPDNLTKVVGYLDLDYSSITSLPDNLEVGGYLSLINTEITSLPDNLTVRDSLYLSNSKITSLPSDLKVGGDLWLNNTEITSLPSDLKVKGRLYIHYTSLEKKYTKEEIRRMCPGIKGEIIKLK